MTNKMKRRDEKLRKRLAYHSQNKIDFENYLCDEFKKAKAVAMLWMLSKFWR